MIQFNLLPDVKLQYVKARRTRRTVMMGSILIAGAFLALFIMLFVVVNVVQKQHLSNLDGDISKSKNDLKAKPELAKILTIQNQLHSLPDLHKQNPVASRILGYVQQVTPQNVNISALTVDFSEQTIKIDGSTDSLATVNTFVDTLKFTNYTIVTADQAAADQEASKTPETPTLAFSDIVLANFAITTGSVKDKNKTASYSITLKYDSVIFNSDNNIKLQIAQKITTRSETEKPSAVFQTKSSDSTTGQEVN
jgi:Tfp pilus assembly protein PilN